MRIAVIGAGAAGCFAAIQAKRLKSDAHITVFEAGAKALAKVAITGGGRCNLTNSFEEVRTLEQVYPRGHRLMKNLFHQFDHKDAYDWFEDAGIALVTQEDNCVFPKSQDAMQIVRALLHILGRLGVELQIKCPVSSVEPCGSGYDVVSPHGREHFDRVIITTGGYSKASMLDMIEPLGLQIIQPVPSLFSLKLESNPLAPLMGIVTEGARARIVGTKLEACGALLITDWGVSGPAILYLSSYGARDLHDCAYECTLSIGWTGQVSQEETVNRLKRLAADNPKKQVANVGIPGINLRLWQHIIARAGINPETRWAELGAKALNKLSATLTDDQYAVKGRGKFQSEYVTCGGVALSNINAATLECKTHPGLYFAGEALDVDALTGGFNLQAAWTTGFVAGTYAVKPQTL